jgi:hypothetical protein
MSLRSSLERAERLVAKREASRPRICPACGKAVPPPFTAYRQGEGWSDMEDACQVCLPEDRVVITIVGATERPAI